MNKILIVTLILGFSYSTFAQSTDTINIAKPIKLPIWTIPVPGASYYYQKKYVEGTIFATLEISGIYLGLKYKDELRSLSSSPYYNFPKAIGLQAFNIEKTANFKNHLEHFKIRHVDFQYHDISEKDLYLSPFKKENILTPITGVMLILAGITLGTNYYLGNQNDSPKLPDIQEMSLADNYLDRNQALSLYIHLAFAQGWGAGVAEEYRYRNWLMPLLDYKYGQRKGLIFSSVIFGFSHLPNYFKADSKETKLAALSQVATTSLAGLVYGLDVQHRNYNIGPSVAAHAWFDMIVMVGSFLINPVNNYLGVDLRLKL
jgi:membrane protease YdiL (CAAX protease family)